MLEIFLYVFFQFIVSCKSKLTTSKFFKWNFVIIFQHLNNFLIEIKILPFEDIFDTLDLLTSILIYRLCFLLILFDNERKQSNFCIFRLTNLLIDILQTHFRFIMK